MTKNSTASPRSSSLKIKTIKQLLLLTRGAERSILHDESAKTYADAALMRFDVSASFAVSLPSGLTYLVKVTPHEYGEDLPF